MRRGVSKRALLVGVALASLVFVAPEGSAQAPQINQDAAAEIAPLQCVFESTATLDVRVQTPRGRRRPARAVSPPRASRVEVVHLEQRHLTFEPITTSLARVRTMEGEPVVTGDARQPWTLHVGTPFDTSGVHVNAGATITHFSIRGDALVADLDLGSHVTLLGARIPCASLTLSTTLPSTAEPVDRRRALRHPRTTTLSLRARAEQGVEAVRLRVTRDVLFEEHARREPFVHVRTTLPFASIDAWSFDTDWVE